MLRYALPRLRDFLFVLLLAGALFSGSRMLNTDSDLGRNLTLGTYILTNRVIPTTDLLSFTKAGESRPPYEWLADILFAIAYSLLNLDGPILLSALAIASAFTLLYLDSVHRSAFPILALFITLWAAIASSLHWLARPHVFSFVFFALWLAMLDRLRRGEPQPLWHFPALMLLWANTHGGFIFGFLACAAYLAGWIFDAWRKRADPRLGLRLLAIAAASLVASFVTPDLWRNWSAVLNNGSAFVLNRTIETMPLNPASWNTWPFLGLLALSLVSLAVSRKQVAVAHVFLLAGLALVSFLIARNIPFFAIAAAPICSYLLGRALLRFDLWARLEMGFSAIDQAMHGFVWSALAVLIAFGVLFYHLRTAGMTLYQWNPQLYPVAAVTWLEQHPQQGQMFNDLNWGGYLIYRMWPAQRVFVDSQTDFYGEPFLRQYVAVLDASPGWEALLSQYGVDWLLVPPSAPLAEIAPQSIDWQIAYRDPTAVILIRR